MTIGLRTGSLLGSAWLAFNLLAPLAAGAGTETMPGSSPIARTELEEKFRITRFGEDGEISVRRTWTGAFAQRERVRLAETSRPDTLKLYLASYQKRYPGVTPLGDIAVSDDTEHDVLALTLKMKSPTVARESAANWTVNYSAANFMDRLPRPGAPGGPLVMLPGTVYRYVVEVEFPDEVVVFGNPLTKRLHDDALVFSLDRNFRGNHAEAVIELELLDRPASAGKPSADAVARTVEVARQAYVAGNSSMYASQEGIRVRRLLAVDKPTLSQIVQHNAVQTIERTTKTIDSLWSRGAELAQAHCDRARAFIALGKMPEAQRDAGLAVGTSPALPWAYACRGVVLAAAGQAQAAIADFSKAIELDPLMPGNYQLRGISYFYDGQLANAAEEFAKGQRANAAKGETSIFVAMWRTVTLKRMGRELEPALQQLAAEHPRGAWPRPALALMHGLVSVDEMLDAAQRKSGVDREMALTEAYFAAGQWYLLQGDKAKAAEYFRKTVDQGVVSFQEHRTAAAELALLEGAGK